MMATGSYDENGFYSYGEDDLADPGQGFSELLNKSAEGVKLAVPVMVHNQVVDELSSDPTIRDAAVEAVNEEITTRDLVQGGDPRLMDTGFSDAFRVRDLDGQVALQVDPDGNTRVERRLVHGRTVTRQSQAFRIMDRHRKVAFAIDEAGRVTIPYLNAVTRLVVVFLTGQSNGEGRGRPYGPELDPIDPRILMWDWPTSTITPATVPLSSTNMRTGLSIGTVFAREILAREPNGTAVLIVNAAVGSSGLVNATSTGKWQWGYTGSQAHLADQAITALRAALNAAAMQFPDITPELRALWHQGEADSDPQYAAYFDELWNGMRSIFGATMTITLGGIVPEYITRNPAKEVIRAAHVDTPRRLLRTAYADGIPNGGYSNPTMLNGRYDPNTDDLVHYTREGVEKLGRAMYQAWRRAVVNTATSKPIPPQTVTARSNNGQLTVTWTNPFCRVTDYLIEHSADGTTWTAAAARSLPLDTTATIATNNRWVRVSTVNELGTSNPSTPTLATGA